MSFNILNPSIKIFGIEIYYYALIITFGMLVAVALSMLFFKRRNIAPDIVIIGFCFVVPFAIVGLRVYYCASVGMPFEQWFSFESMRQGGLAFYGGLIGGIIGGALGICVIKKVNFLRALDCILPNVMLAQSIGRWANFVNQEAHGDIVTNPSLQWFPFAVYIDNGTEPVGWYYATFFYESFLNLIGAILLFILVWKFMKKPNGLISCGYFIWYGIVRAIVEGFRTDSLWWGPFRASQLLSIIFVVAGVVAAFVLMLINYKKEGAWIGSKNGDPLGISKFYPAYKGEFLRKNKISYLQPEDIYSEEELSQHARIEEEERVQTEEKKAKRKEKWENFKSKFKKK